MNKTLTMILSLVMLSTVSADPYGYIYLNIESGVFNGDPSSQEEHFLAYSLEVGESNVTELRLYFGETNLGNNSYVTIRSVYDNIEQIHNTQTLSEWKNTSIFFNGDLLAVELYVHRDDVNIFIALDKIFIGISSNDVNNERSICGEVDNREPSNHGAIGRLVPFGCTAWIAENGLIVTAGHCLYPLAVFDELDDEIIEFNVPMSLEDGAIQHPEVEDQYIVGDYALHEFFGIVEESWVSDWAVFNVENNSSTGLQPIEAQGISIGLSRTNDIADDEIIRLTGFGFDGPPPSYGGTGALNEYSQTQQTSSGPFVSIIGTRLNFIVDAMDGNSGGPIIRESDGTSLGIYNLHDCNGYNPDSYNSGVSLLNDNLWMALHPNSVFLSNRDVANNDNLGGLLTLDNTETPEFEYPEINSVDLVPLDIETGPNYIATTTEPNLGENGELRHIRWNDNREDYFLEIEHYFLDNSEQLTAFFTNQHTATIESTHPVELELHDPWYAYKEEPNGPWIQSDKFFPVCELAPDGTYLVFLHQGGNIEYLIPPNYSILTEKYFDNDEGEIYEFTHWSGVNVLIENIDELATGVIFTNEDASITANYEFYTENGNLVNNISYWNIVGLPRTVEDDHYFTLFPNSIEGTCLRYENGYYVSESNLTSGEGYWLRFSESGENVIIGEEITELTFDLTEGWQLISGISETVPISYILDPDRIIIRGTIMDYNNQVVGELVPGKGYWVRASQPGTITITNRPSSPILFTSLMEDANYIKFTNATGKEKEVYFGVDVPEEDQLSYTLPPLPPDEVMEENFLDARYTNNYTYTETAGTIEVRNTDYPLTVEYGILNDDGEWEISSNAPKRRRGDEEYGDIGRVKLSRTGTIVVEHPIESFTIRKTSVNNLPTEFALSQNYPNPFNPTTVIRYQLPVISEVQLTVYDLMGRVVRELVSSKINAGTHSIIWNGTDAHGQPVSSGMYLYQLKTDTFVKTKKLVLLK